MTKKMQKINKKTYVNVNEFADVIMKFIGSERYQDILGSIANSKEAGFTAGLAFASCLMASDCKLYEEAPAAKKTPAKNTPKAKKETK